LRDKKRSEEEVSKTGCYRRQEQNSFLRHATAGCRVVLRRKDAPSFLRHATAGHRVVLRRKDAPSFLRHATAGHRVVLRRKDGASRSKEFCSNTSTQNSCVRKATPLPFCNCGAKSAKSEEASGWMETNRMLNEEVSFWVGGNRVLEVSVGGSFLSAGPRTTKKKKFLWMDENRMLNEEVSVGGWKQGCWKFLWVEVKTGCYTRQPRTKLFSPQRHCVLSLLLELE